MLRYLFPSILLLLQNSTPSKAPPEAVADDVLHKDLDVLLTLSRGHKVQQASGLLSISCRVAAKMWLRKLRRPFLQESPQAPSWSTADQLRGSIITSGLPLQMPCAVFQALRNSALVVGLNQRWLV